MSEVIENNWNFFQWKNKMKVEKESLLQACSSEAENDSAPAQGVWNIVIILN